MLKGIFFYFKGCSMVYMYRFTIDNGSYGGCVLAVNEEEAEANVYGRNSFTINDFENTK